MSDSTYCGGCGTEVAGPCRQALSRRGCIKVHWECWSDCNLNCPFCYRSIARPLETDQALLLLRVIRTAGIQSIVFAGGDPSIRNDLNDIVGAARDLEMRIEIQTNGHRVRPRLLEVLRKADMVGLSLDGEDAETHDRMRQKPGNFRRVLELMAALDEAHVPMIVRTVVTKVNVERIIGLCEVLSNVRHLTRWSIMEFIPAGQGALTSAVYSIDRGLFNRAFFAIERRFPRENVVQAYRVEDRIGVYCLIGPDGQVFGTAGPGAAASHPVAGHALTNHIAAWSERLCFDTQRHEKRYGADEVRSQLIASDLR